MPRLGRTIIVSTRGSARLPRPPYRLGRAGERVQAAVDVVQELAPGLADEVSERPFNADVERER